MKNKTSFNQNTTHIHAYTHTHTQFLFNRPIFPEYKNDNKLLKIHLQYILLYRPRQLPSLHIGKYASAVTKTWTDVNWNIAK